MLGYNRTIRRTNINVLLNTGPGTGGRRKKKEVKKKNNLPNTFDDDRSKLKAAGFLLGLVVKFFEFT